MMLITFISVTGVACFFLPQNKVKCFPTFSVMEGLPNLHYFRIKQSSFVTRKLRVISIRRIPLYICAVDIEYFCRYLIDSSL